MRELDYAPAGKVFVKPNVVFSSPGGRYGTTAYTHPTLVGASLVALANSDGVARVDLGENTAVGLPTRHCFKHAGYYDELREVRRQARAPVDMFCIDESKRDEVFLGGLVHETLRVARPMARADSMVYLPKLKCHCVSNVTAAVKLNIGICSDDERSIRHDYALNDKIVDLLAVGYPDFIVVDAIDVGVGNEGEPTPRRLGLLLMGRNPMAVDLVGARLLGYGIDDVPYLARAAERGYTPGRLKDVVLLGDIDSVADIDEAAKRILPYDDEFYRWQDIQRELERLQSPLRFHWGYSRREDRSQCLYGCVMGVKMWLSLLEWHAGAEAFAKAKPVSLVVGKVEEQIDAQGHEVFLIGSCAEAPIVNAEKVTRLDSCFTTSSDMTLKIGGRLGIPSPSEEPREMLRLLGTGLGVAARKAIKGRYLQDIGHFMAKGLTRRV
jgi:uncharacterized protein (DUF362 family)